MLISPILILSATVLIAFILLLSNKLSPDVIALCVALVLGLSGVLTSTEMLAGFSSSAVITILGAFIMTHALAATGVTRKMSKLLTRIGSRGERQLVWLVMILSAGLSLIMNKIVAAAVLLPAATEASTRARVSLSRVMMPLAFATSLGGMMTLLNTGNLVVSAALKQEGLPGYDLLDFVIVGLPVAILGIIATAFLSRHVLGVPASGMSTQGETGLSEKLAEWYELGARLNQVRIPEESPLVHKTLLQSHIGERLGLSVLGITRNHRVIWGPTANEMIQAGDRLIVVGHPDRVKQLEWWGTQLESEYKFDRDTLVENGSLYEVILSPRSLAIGRTLKELHFRERFGATVFALWHGGRSIRTDQSLLRLQYGDSMLVYGPVQSIKRLQHDLDFIVLHSSIDSERPVRADRAALAMVITAAALGLSAFDILPVAEAMLVGAMAMVLTGCLKMEEAYRAVDWRAIFLIAGMSSVSTAMIKTGAADLLGKMLVGQVASYGPWMVAMSLLVVTMLITQIISGQVAAFFLAPIAIAAARAVGADPRTMAMYVAFGGSLTFLTPAAHSANLLVMGAGNYSSRDYVRLGLPLTIILMVAIMLIVPLILHF